MTFNQMADKEKIERAIKILREEELPICSHCSAHIANVDRHYHGCMVARLLAVLEGGK